MRLTPAQIGVQLICGRESPRIGRRSLRERIVEGRETLVEVSGQDFGFDLQQWHDYLKETRDGGYTWNRSIDLPAVMKAALVDPEWLEAVREIEG